MKLGTRGEERKLRQCAAAGAVLLALWSAALLCGEAVAERELSAAETAAALKTVAAGFQAHPAFRAAMSVRVTDLLGERTEEGWIAIARPARVLRHFTKPAAKIWFLDALFLREYLPGKNEILVKDFSAAPRLLNWIRAALGGDFAALEELFSFKAFATVGAATPGVRFELTKKSSAPKLLHRRITASMQSGALFFDEIHYEPDDGDEIVERFTEFKELSGPQADEFSVQWPKDAAVKTTRITE